VFEIASKKGTLRPFARISRVSAVITRHVVMLLILLEMSVDRGGIAMVVFREVGT
jgi:hypothetical protein